jgi:hypothetical protein
MTNDTPNNDTPDEESINDAPIVVPAEDGEVFALPFADRVQMAIFFMVDTVMADGRRAATERDVRYAAKRWSTSVKVADGWVDRSDYDSMKVGIIQVLNRLDQP